jgi:purine nucleosidase
MNSFGWVIALTLIVISSAKLRVIFDHDAGVDDLLTLMYLVRAGVNLSAVTVVPADSLKDSAVQSTRAILSLMVGNESERIPVAVSDDIGVNPFPMNWRVHAQRVLEIPQIASRSNVGGHLSPLSPAQLIVDLLLKEKMIIICTGPLSNIAAALVLNKSIAGNIERIYIMVLLSASTFMCAVHALTNYSGM